MSNSRLKSLVFAATCVFLLLAFGNTVDAGVVVLTDNATVWSSQVASVQTEPFENVPSSFVQHANPPGLTRNSINYSINRTIDTSGRMLEVSPGIYAPTGVLSMQDTPNGEFSNVMITPSTPTDSFAVRHASFRGSQVQFMVTFTDSTTEVFFANTTGVTSATVSGTNPMRFTGVIADMLISSILIQTTVSANDAFARGLNIDDFATAQAIPEPSSASLLAIVSLCAFHCQKRRLTSRKRRN